MKSCIPICLIAFALLGFFLGSQFVKLRGNLFTQFKNTLNSFQLGIYKEIIRERACIFSFGLFFGLGLPPYSIWSPFGIRVATLMDLSPFLD